MRNILFFASALLPATGVALAQPSISIVGTVTAPPGHTIEGLVARQCLDGCSWHRDTKIKGTGRTATFDLFGEPSNQYEVMFYKDANGDDDGPGDLYGRIPRMVRTGEGPHNVRLYEYTQMKQGALDQELRGNPPKWPGESDTDMAGAAPGGLTGSFRYSWSGKESGAKTTVTTKAGIVSGAGGLHSGSGAGHMVTNLGTTYGVTEGTRSIRVDLNPDGTFRWLLDSNMKDAKCRIKKHEEKTGKAFMDGAKIIFHSTGGTRTIDDSCMTGPQTNSIESETHEFNFRKTGNGFTLTGGLESLTMKFTRG